MKTNYNKAKASFRFTQTFSYCLYVKIYPFVIFTLNNKITHFCHAVCRKNHTDYIKKERKDVIYSWPIHVEWLSSSRGRDFQVDTRHTAL